jgi:hypothetical protein
MKVVSLLLKYYKAILEKNKEKEAKLQTKLLDKSLKHKKTHRAD